MILAALPLLLSTPPALPAPQPPTWHWSDVQAWKWSEGRQERIPSLSATLVNSSGEDWAEASFRVRVACLQGPPREFAVLLRDLLIGSQHVEATAFDAIGQVEACDGPAAVEFVSGRKYPPSQRPAYVLFGFSLQQDDSPPFSQLAGILDYRKHSESDQETHPHWLPPDTQPILLPNFPGAAFYCLRVEPGALGLSGFLLKPGDPSSNPLSRFLRLFDVPPGAIAYLGVFRLQQGPGRLHSLTIDPAPAVLSQIAPPIPRRILQAVPAAKDASAGLTVGN
jgi:hypothetical protein